MGLALSFSTGTLYHFPLRTTFRLVSEAGFDGVELVLGPEVVLRGASYVRRLSQQHGLPVLSIHPPIIRYPGQGHPARLLPRLIALAEQVNCDLIVLHTPKTESMEDARWQQFLAVVLRERAGTDVRVSLENGGIFRSGDQRYLLHDLRRLRVFADHHNLPITFDASHAGTSDHELVEAYATVNGRVVNVHLSDLARQPLFPDWPPLYTFFRHHQLPGDGVLPLAEFMRVLVVSGYSGPVTLEVSPVALKAWSPSRVREGLAKAIASMRGMLSG
jgi:sugar phosphate isomerase/epimerase